MISGTAYRSMLEKAWRIDARFFGDKGNAAYLRVSQGPWRKIRLGEFVGDEKVWAPSLFTRVYAANEQYGKPYVAPSDTLRYMTLSKQYLSRTQTKNFLSYEVEHGWLLVTCSGRNLGPSVWVDRYLARFIVTHDMVRISSEDEEKQLYLMAFLHTPTGQSLLRRDKNGSVIDHIGPKQVRDLYIPIVDGKLRMQCVEAFKAATLLRERGRLALNNATIYLTDPSPCEIIDA